MKVLHYVNENILSWANPFLQLLQYFNGMGIENVLLCPPGGTLSEKASIYGVEVLYYEPKFSSLPGLCRGFGKMARSVNPDIIHTRLSSAAFIASEWKHITGCPVLSTVDKYAKLKYYLKSDHLVAVSNGVKDWFVKSGYPEEKMSVIGNPLDLSFYEPVMNVRERIRSEEGISTGTKIILGAGRFVDWKGFDILLKASEKALEGSDFIIWLAGDGPEKTVLESYVASSPVLSEHVKFWGFVHDIRPFLWASDLFILPSSKPEPFGLVLLEAMACGLPVIATSAGGPIDIVSDDTGWLVPPGDVKSLCSTIQKALKDPEFKLKGSASLKRASRFDVKTIGDEYIQKYRSLIN